MPSKALVTFSLIAVIALLGLLYIWQAGQKFEIDKASPDGRYRVKIEIREEKAQNSLGYTEKLNVQYWKGEEILLAYDGENSEQYEPSLRDGYQIVEWVDDNVLRMSRDRLNQPFYDSLIVANRTDEYIKFMNIGYGKGELFEILELAPNTQISLRASPGFYPDGSSRYFLGFGGMTQSGKNFEGVMEKQKRKSPDEGPFTFQISLQAKDLR
jgi:hypothetical protein